MNYYDEFYIDKARTGATYKKYLDTFTYIFWLLSFVAKIYCKRATKYISTSPFY